VSFTDRAIVGSQGKFIDEKEHVVIAHLIGIGLPFLDRGKSNLLLPYEMIDSISGAVWSASKDLYKEYKARQKEAAKQERADKARQKENSNFIIDSVFQVLPDAIQSTTDNWRYRQTSGSFITRCVLLFSSTRLRS